MNTTMADANTNSRLSRPRRKRQKPRWSLLPLTLILLLDVNTCHAGVHPYSKWGRSINFPSFWTKRTIGVRLNANKKSTELESISSILNSSSSSSSSSLPLSIARHGASPDWKAASTQSGSSSYLPSFGLSPPSSMNKQLLEWRRKIRLFLDDLVTGTVQQQGSRIVHHVLYWITAADAVHSIILNDYSTISFLGVGSHHIETSSRFVPSVYSRLFYFARLRPRLLYAIGALLRALQLCTPFRRILDPSAGVGAGINLCALLAGSRWVKPLVLGWATTKWTWTWLGARQVDKAYLPITLSIHEWEDKKKNAKKASSKSDSSSE